MKEKLKRYFKEIIIFIILLTLVSNAISYYRSQDLNKQQLDISQVTLLDGQSYTVPQNKPILIHFWATWCPTCKFESSNIQKLSKTYEVLTIAVQSGSNEEIQDYMKKHDLSFKVVNDAQGYFANRFNIKAYPTTFIYDANKNVHFSEVGYTTTLGLIARMKLAQ